MSDVAGLQAQINKSYEAVQETNTLLTRLRNSNDDVWKGDAGNAFRASFDATLAQDLGYAQSSLEKAVALIQEWHTNLVSFQNTAKGLETEAAEARAQLTQATAKLQQARSNPDLSLANQSFSDADLPAAQARLNAAIAQVQSASAAVDDWQEKLDALIKRARDLETTHDTLARRIASELDTAAKDFAPSPPDKSIWDSITDWIKGVGDWIDEHRKGLYDILSTTAAIAGLLAVVTPPPIDAIALGVALVAGAGALGLSLTDEELRDDLLNGSLKEKGMAALQLTGDTLGLIPGVGALGKTLKVGVLGEAVDAAADVGRHAASAVPVGRLEAMARTFSEAAHNPGWLNQKMIDNNTFNITNQLTDSGASAAVHKVLQFTGVEGKFSTPDPASALLVFKRAEGAAGALAGLAIGKVFGD
ncbi:hypothetical protein [Nocardia sp. XZ_19_385]|uniref:hypothetical protein n=1 Tax=Nocardia sp. XZ_19_385 TaxID=2769488 RepID=UPI00188E6645|nr:hypothetical protein [Nocardia sp. XZ_19_385]